MNHTELAARRAAAKKRHILALTPHGLEHVAEKCIRDGLSSEEARKRLLEAHKKAHASVKDLSDREFGETLGEIGVGVGSASVRMQDRQKASDSTDECSDRELVNALCS